MMYYRIELKNRKNRNWLVILHSESNHGIYFGTERQSTCFSKEALNHNAIQDFIKSNNCIIHEYEIDDNYNPYMLKILDYYQIP